MRKKLSEMQKRGKDEGFFGKSKVFEVSGMNEVLGESEGSVLLVDELVIGKDV